MLTGELKEYLVEKINEFLEEHRARREEARKLINLYMYDGELARRMWREGPWSLEEIEER